jgi:DNA-binding CsgD family transcriptional regulator
MGRALCGFCSMGRTVRPPTRRQVECAEAAVRAMLEGRNQHDAAASLGLGYQTFRNHLRDARRRAGVTRTTQLARYFTGLA